MQFFCCHKKVAGKRDHPLIIGFSELQLPRLFSLGESENEMFPKLPVQDCYKCDCTDNEMTAKQNIFWVCEEKEHQIFLYRLLFGPESSCN